MSIWESNVNGFVFQVDVIDADNIARTVWTGTDLSASGAVVEFRVDFSRTNYLAKE